MKIELTGKIKRMARNELNLNLINSSDMVDVELEFKGNVVDTLVTAKEATMKATLKVKPYVAEKLLFGSKINITITEENLEKDEKINHE